MLGQFFGYAGHVSPEPNRKSTSIARHKYNYMIFPLIKRILLSAFYQGASHRLAQASATQQVVRSYGTEV